LELVCETQNEDLELRIHRQNLNDIYQMITTESKTSIYVEIRDALGELADEGPKWEPLRNIADEVYEKLRNALCVKYLKG
jgi:hypothetical protein